MSEEIISSEYSEVMQKSYIDYAMSVICARAVPDVRDGLKPVQRRVLYAMDELGLKSDRPHRKCARIVGDTMGKYHPHGDSSIYETLVVMSQDFKKEMPLVDGHGNFGSIEGDGAAAMRYTEARLEKFTQDVYLADLDKNVVDFVPNFDETEKEPEVLPVRIPNILVNGSEGIAVGMTTSIPTHNLGEVIDAQIAYMKKKSITTEELMSYVQGPDFPTGGLVINKSDLKDIYETGTGRIKLRGRVVFEPGKKGSRDKLVITEIPYTMIGANNNKFIQDICDLAESKKTTDIVNISNESDKDGIRIVLELKKGADREKLENLLYKKTRLEDTFGVNMLVISDGRPEVLGLKGILEKCTEFQYEINTRKYTTLLEKDKEQQEIHEGLIKACDIIDLIIEVIRGSRSIAQARDCLTNGNTKDIKFKSKESEKEASELCFTERQATAILDLRLAKLIGLEIEKLKKEYDELTEEIARYEKILSDNNAMKKVIIKDLENIKKEYAADRKTEILDAAAAVYVEEAPKEIPVVFLMDRFGYAKLVDTAAYERNSETIDAENKYVLRCLSTDRICIFTQTGVMHQLKAQSLPVKKPKEKGVPIDNLCNYTSVTENIVYVAPMRDLVTQELLFTTKLGMMKFVDAAGFDVSKRTVAATKLNEGDELVDISAFDGAGLTQMIYDEEEDFDVTLSGGVDPDDSYDMTFGELLNIDKDGNGVAGIEGGISSADDSGKDPGGETVVIDSESEADDQLMFSFIDFSGGSEDVTVSLDDGPGAGGSGTDQSSGSNNEAKSASGMSKNENENGSENREPEMVRAEFSTNKMVVLQTKDGVFLRFRLNEIPEKKKGAVGMRGIKLADGDEIDKVYIVGNGDKTTISYRDKEIELMKIKLAKRGGKGTTPRV